MMKKKILFVYYQNIKQGGVSKAIANISESLADEGFDVTILFLMAEHKDFFPIDSRVKKIYINSFDTPYYKAADYLYNKTYLKEKVRKLINYSYDFGCFFVLKDWIEKNHNQYDQIISCWYKLSSYLTFTEAANKTIAWEHINHKTGGFLFFNILRKRYQKLQGIACLTESSFNYYKYINPNTVKISNIIGGAYEKCELKFLEKNNNVLIASRLDPEKNIGEFLEIIKASSLPHDWSVSIAGDGRELTALKSKADSLGLSNVKFLGSLSQEELLIQYKKSKIFCITSLVEGLPTTLIEAMFCGNALIGYDCPTGPSEIINENNGFLIPLHDKQLFREKLEFLIKNPPVLATIMASSQLDSAKWKKENVVQAWLQMLDVKSGI